MLRSNDLNNDLRTIIADQIQFVKWFVNPLRSSDLNQMIREPASKFWSESNDSWTRFKVLIWIKWFVNPLRSSDLNQMIREPASKFWSESNDSWTRFEVLIWIKWFVNPLRSSDLNQMIREPASKFWSSSFDQIIHQPRSDRNQMIHNPIGALLISESFCDAIVKLIRSLENLWFNHHYKQGRRKGGGVRTILRARY